MGGRGALAALAVSVAAAPASAQEPIGVAYPEVVPVGSGQVRAMFDVPVRIAGRLTLEFRGDAAAGCAITGVCGLSGTVTWRPSRRGQLAVAEYVLRGRRRFAATLGPTGESVTRARVNRRGADGSAGVCSDSGRFYSGMAVADAVVGRAARISLPGTGRVDALSTRCAGPLQSDLAGALPTARLGRALPAHRSRLDLRGRRPFSAHGFAGSVRSTITVRVGRPERRPRSRSPRRGERLRGLTATYAIERIEGGVTTTLAGSADPAACGPLDACGVTGTITSAFGQTRKGRLSLSAATDGRRPWRDLRAALGLTRGGRRRGVVVLGFGTWEGGPGSAVNASIQHPDGGPPCADSAPLLAGSVFLHAARRRSMGVQYHNQPDALRTRCPGPRHADVSVFGRAPLAAGRIPLRALAGRRPVLRIRQDAPFRSEGYTGRTRIDFTFHLRRIRLTRQTIVS